MNRLCNKENDKLIYETADNAVTGLQQAKLPFHSNMRLLHQLSIHSIYNHQNISMNTAEDLTYRTGTHLQYSLYHGSLALHGNLPQSCGVSPVM